MIEDEVIAMLRSAHRIGIDDSSISGASEDEITRFEMANNFRLPDELKQWFGKCNGSPVNPGGLYSLGPVGNPSSVEWFFKEYPDWKTRGWIPLADDGCGDIYIAVTSYAIGSNGSHPVCFLDQADFDKPAYSVASGIWQFIYFLLENETLWNQGMCCYWPFDREQVVRRDPELLECGIAPLPWDADVV